MSVVYPAALYDMQKQLSKGEHYERVLDSHFSKWYAIRPVDRNLQRIGIDRIWKDYKNGIEFSVEYKSDETAARTGNVFLEIVSVDTADKPGWVLTGLAQMILYYIPPLGVIYSTALMQVKYAFFSKKWCEREKLPIQNHDYKTIGVAIPFAEFEAACCCEKHILAPAHLATRT